MQETLIHSSGGCSCWRGVSEHPLASSHQFFRGVSKHEMCHNEIHMSFDYVFLFLTSHTTTERKQLPHGPRITNLVYCLSNSQPNSGMQL